MSTEFCNACFFALLFSSLKIFSFPAFLSSFKVSYSIVLFGKLIVVGTQIYSGQFTVLQLTFFLKFQLAFSTCSSFLILFYTLVPLPCS